MIHEKQHCICAQIYLWPCAADGLCCAADEQPLIHTPAAESQQQAENAESHAELDRAYLVMLLALLIGFEAIHVMTGAFWAAVITHIISNIAGATYAHWTGGDTLSMRNSLILGGSVVLCSILIAWDKTPGWLTATSNIVLSLSGSCWSGQLAVVLPGKLILIYHMLPPLQSCLTRCSTRVGHGHRGRRE